MQAIPGSAAPHETSSKAAHVRLDRQWLLLVLVCALAGTLAALALSRFYFLGYGMTAPAVAGVLAGMLAWRYVAASTAGILAAVLSLLVLGTDRFYRLYEIPVEPSVTVLLIVSWMLAGAVGGLVGVKAFRKWGQTFTIVMLATVLSLFLVTTHSESSFMTAQAATDPPAKSYGVDGVLYLKTFYLMKQGEDFYSAFRSAVKQDLRVDIPGVADHPAQYFNYRLPTLHQLWVWLLPPKGDYVLSLLIALELVALASAFLIVYKWTGSPVALLAPILLGPHYSLFAGSWYFDFSELWSALLLVIAGLLFVFDRRIFAVAVVALVLAIRELFLFAPLAGVTASLLAGKRSHVAFWLAPVVVFLGLEAFQYAQIVPYLTVTDERTWSNWLAGGGVEFALRTLRFGAVGISANDLVPGLLLVLAVVGLLRVPTLEQKAFFGILLLAPLVSFLFVGHGGEIGDAYWGFTYSSTMLLLAPMFFDLVLRHRTCPSQDKYRVSPQKASS